MSNISYIAYNSDGMIEGVYSGSDFTPEFLAEITPVGGGLLLGNVSDSRKNYVNTSLTPIAVAARPEMSYTVDVTTIIADGTSYATLSGIPTGWDFYLDGVLNDITDGTNIQFSASEVGAYKLKFSNWPYQDIEVTINANPIV